MFIYEHRWVQKEIATIFPYLFRVPTSSIYKNHNWDGFYVGLVWLYEKVKSSELAIRTFRKNQLKNYVLPLVSEPRPHFLKVPPDNNTSMNKGATDLPKKRLPGWKLIKFKAIGCFKLSITPEKEVQAHTSNLKVVYCSKCQVDKG